jgi:hypothetical protein
MIFALQVILTSVFRELAKDPKLEAAIKAGFDAAEDSGTALAMQRGKEERRRDAIPPETVGWLDVLEFMGTCREMTFPPGEPERDDPRP